MGPCIALCTGAREVFKPCDLDLMQPWDEETLPKNRTLSQDDVKFLASRGCTGQQLGVSQWFTGPQFLWQKVIPTPADITFEEEIPINEIKQSVGFVSQCDQENLHKLFARHSRWMHLIGIIAVCFRFLANLRLKN